MPKLFELEEWRRNILPKLVKLCAVEALSKGQFGKRGARASREAIASCVRSYANQLKSKKIAELRAQLESELSRLKSELGV